MKKLIIGLLLIFMSLGLAWLSYAQDVQTFPSGTSLKVIIDPSIDSRVTGHSLYWKNQSTDVSKKADMATTPEYLISPGTLLEETVYEFSATAYGLINGSPAESAHSNAKLVRISKPSLPGGDGLATTFSDDFESFSAGATIPAWISTGENNNMAEAIGLHEVFDLSGNKVFGTGSTLPNIHAHLTKCYLDQLTTAEFTGKMMITDTKGGVGVTFLSRYPFADTYYRLRATNYGTFHLSPHTATASGTTDTGIVPQANQWYRFRIKVSDVVTRTEILAKVWQEADTEPAWQVVAYDDTPDRLVSGTFGVWSHRSGAKYWDDLKIAVTPSGDLCSPQIIEIKGN
jgi:hypothetical protein